MKKNFWGKLGLGLAAVALVFGLSACGKKATNNKTADGKTEITFWHGMNGPYNKAINKIIDDFNKSQDKYVVKGTAQGNYTALQQKIMAAAKSRKLPTIAQTTYTTVPDYAKDGLITDLDSYINGKNGLDKDSLADIYPAFLNSSKYNGKFYSIPFSKSTRIMYANQDLMKKLGIKEVPSSWEELAKLGPKLKAQGVAVLGFDKSYDMEFEGLAKQAGMMSITDDPLKANLTAPSTLKAVHLINDMIKDGYAKTAGEDVYGDKNFTSGKTLFYIGSSAGITNMKQNAPKSLNWTTSPLPTYNGNQATEIAGNDIVMFGSASDEQKKGAWEFMKFLLSKEQTINWSQSTGYVPVRKSAVEDPKFQEYLKQNPTSAAAVNSLEFGFQTVAFRGYNEYRTKLLSSVDAMLTKDETPEKAFGELQTDTEKILKENN